MTRATYKPPRVMRWFAGHVIGEPWTDSLGNVWVHFRSALTGAEWAVPFENVTLWGGQ